MDSETKVGTSFVYLRPLKVACVRATGPYGLSAKEAWSRMFAWMNESGMIRSVGTGYGLLLDDPRFVETEACRYDACVELIGEFSQLLPSDFGIRRLPGGAYARCRHNSGNAGLGRVISKMRDDWAPSRGLLADARRPVIEIYLDNPQIVGAENCRVDVCLPVVAALERDQSAA